MKVIAGRLGGRKFDGPKGNRTHPMSDRAKGALFNMLGDISNDTVLDAFAGTGALSFEALSRGALSAVAIDVDKRAFFTIQENVKKLNLEAECKVTRANAGSWSDNNLDKKFSIVIAAPPYDNLQLPTINKLVRHLEPKGRFILDWPGKKEPPIIDGLVMTRQKVYGDAQVVIYQIDV